MRGISLFSLRKRANECLISEKRVFAHFGPKISKKIDTVFLINYEDIISSKMGAGVFLP